jgi:hypothetical protein
VAFMTRIEKFDSLALRQFIGLFMVVFGVMGMATYFLPYTSTASARMGFAAMVAGIWTGLSMVLLRWPSAFLTAFWAGSMLAAWQFKYGALSF